MQNQSYLYDLVGNLTQRQNNNLGLTENFYYDNLYRLDYSRLNGVTNPKSAYEWAGAGCGDGAVLIGGSVWD